MLCSLALARFMERESSFSEKKRLDFASSFKELGYIPFDENKLDAKGLDLLKELGGRDYHFSRFVALQMIFKNEIIRKNLSIVLISRSRSFRKSLEASLCRISIMKWFSRLVAED